MEILYKKRGRATCAAINCNNTASTCSYGFFRFPREEARAEKWALAAGRRDLIPRKGTLHMTHRLCGAHFEKKMLFTNHPRKTLLFQAVPTLFPCLEDPTSGVLREHSYSSNFVNVPGASVLESDGGDQLPLHTDIANNIVEECVIIEISKKQENTSATLNHRKDNVVLKILELLSILKTVTSFQELEVFETAIAPIAPTLSALAASQSSSPASTNINVPHNNVSNET